MKAMKRKEKTETAIEKIISRPATLVLEAQTEGMPTSTPLREASLIMPHVKSEAKNTNVLHPWAVHERLTAA